MDGGNRLRKLLSDEEVDMLTEGIGNLGRDQLTRYLAKEFLEFFGSDIKAPEKIRQFKEKYIHRDKEDYLGHAMEMHRQMLLPGTGVAYDMESAIHMSELYMKGIRKFIDDIQELLEEAQGTGNAAFLDDVIKLIEETKERLPQSDPEHEDESKGTNQISEKG